MPAPASGRYGKPPYVLRAYYSIRVDSCYSWMASVGQVSIPAQPLEFGPGIG